MSIQQKRKTKQNAVERELKSVATKLATALKIGGYNEGSALIKATHIAVSRLPCPLLAAWVLHRVVRGRFGDAAAVAASAGVLIYSCGRADYDTITSCAERGCGSTAVDTKTADAVMKTAYEVGVTIGLPQAEALRLAGLLKYRYLNFSVIAPELKGEGALWGELIAYALRLMQAPP